MKNKKKSTVLHNIFLVITHSSLAFLGYHASIGPAQADFQRKNYPVSIEYSSAKIDMRAVSFSVTMPHAYPILHKNQPVNNN